MKTINISLDNLDSALEQIKELQYQVEHFTADLAEETKANVGYSDVSADHMGERHIITAKDEDIAFKEFGAGYVADYEDGFQDMGGDPFHTEPGIWSESHARTFQKHQQSGQAPSTYRFNRTPTNRMQRAAQNVHSKVGSKAREYFK